jgi:hypothetical protein
LASFPGERVPIRTSEPLAAKPFAKACPTSPLPRTPNRLGVEEGAMYDLQWN